jgi:hypothetical protein
MFLPPLTPKNLMHEVLQNRLCLYTKIHNGTPTDFIRMSLLLKRNCNYFFNYLLISKPELQGDKYMYLRIYNSLNTAEIMYTKY